MSKESQHTKPDERLRVTDSLGVVLHKADGSVITNKLKTINTEYLLMIIEEAKTGQQCDKK